MNTGSNLALEQLIADMWYSRVGGVLVAMVPHFKRHHDDEATQQCQPRKRCRGALLVMRMLVIVIMILRRESVLITVLVHEQRSTVVMAVLITVFIHAVQSLKTLWKNCTWHVAHS